jgi:hypothetical protein
MNFYVISFLYTYLIQKYCDKKVLSTNRRILFSPSEALFFMVVKQKGRKP